MEILKSNPFYEKSITKVVAEIAKDRDVYSLV